MVRWFPLDTWLHEGLGRFLPLPRIVRLYVCYRLDQECGWEGTFKDFNEGR